jgi:L-ascorbate metabolism protein UlaG (beta-lactamase superfamily)
MEQTSLHIQHLRHATFLLTIAGKTLLVDPMLAGPGDLPPVPLTRNRQRNPLVPLPIELSALNEIDGILVTHLHFDHFDAATKNLLRKDLPILCQPSDVKALHACGFQETIPIEVATGWEALRFTRVSAQHGQGLVRLLMGKGSGYMVQFGANQTIYLAGDTIYTDTIAQQIAHFQPQTIILYAGAAQMAFGKPITMTAEDVIAVCRAAPTAKGIALHIEAINHCGLTRRALAAQVAQAGVGQQVLIPVDGEHIQL